MIEKEGKFGLSVALATAFDEGGKIDYDETISHAKRCLENGCDSVTLLGTTAEAASVAREERDHLLRSLTSASVSGNQLVMGILATDVSGAVSQIRQSIEFGCSHLLIAPPYYFKQVSDQGIIEWYCKVLESFGSELPVCLLYNLPSQTGVVINSAIVSALRARFGSRIGGVKDSSGDIGSTTALLEDHKDLAILVGDERQLAKAVNSGGQGSICGVANIFPERINKIIKTGTDDKMVVSFVNELSRYPIIPALKYAMSLNQKKPIWQMVRAPLMQLDDKQKYSIEKWLDTNPQ